MEQTTINAIIGSIKKWDCIAQGVGVDKGTINCPLCKMFFYKTTLTIRCRKCPVAAKVNVNGCSFTPYSDSRLTIDTTLPDWIKAEAGNYGYINKTIDCVEKEIEFLISLLPDEQKYKL